MKKSLAIACATLMLLTGCGSGGGSVVSEVPTTDAGDIVYNNGKDELIGCEWKESFIVTLENGIEVPFDVDLVTSIFSEDADSVIQYTNSYDTNANRRKMIEYLHPGCKLSYVGDNYLNKSTIQGIISRMEVELNTTDWNSLNNGPEVKASLQNEINYFEKLLEKASYEYDDVTEIRDGRYYVTVDEKVVAIVAFNDPWYGDDFFQYSCLDDEFRYSNSVPERVEIEKEREIANGILTLLESELGEIYDDPNDDVNGNNGEMLAYTSLMNSYKKNQLVNARVLNIEDKTYVVDIDLTPLVITDTKKHVSLLNFEEVKNAIKNSLKKEKIFKSDRSNELNKLELALYPVETEDGGAYVPAWILQDGKLIINAIDGTFIDAIYKK